MTMLLGYIESIYKKKAAGKKEAPKEKKKTTEPETVEKDKEVSVSLLNIKVGLISKAWKHPSADRYVDKMFFAFFSLLAF